MSGAVIGSGSDTLKLTVAQDAWQGNARFIVTVDGQQIGGAQMVTATALHQLGQSETFTIDGNFGSGQQIVGVSFINDAYGGSSAKDRNLYVEGVSYDGQNASPGTASLYSNGTANFDFAATAAAPAGPIAGPTIGSGPDTLKLSVQQDAWQGNAEFTVQVDGRQIGGIQTVNPGALHSGSTTETFTIDGSFGSGSHTVKVSFINDAYGGTSAKDRNLYVTGLSLDGQSDAQGSAALYSNGSASFTVQGAASAPPVSTPVSTPPVSAPPVTTPPVTTPPVTTPPVTTPPVSAPPVSTPPVSTPPVSTPPASSTILTVGSGEEYSTLSAAVAAAKNGDTIQVQAGTYYNDVVNVNANITIEGVGGMVNEVSTYEPSNRKALLDVYGNVTIDNMSFSGVAVSNNDGGNGAGIRYEGGNLTLNNDAFYNNQDGLLANADPNGTITINNSEFANNGSGSGYTHNIYIGDVASVTIDNSYFTGANVGHEIKSRAENTTIENSRIQDGPGGTASYSIDTPNGGNVVIQNNVIEKSATAGNPVMITSGEEGGIHANSSLTVTGNTIINDHGGSTVMVRNDTGGSATISGNQLWGLSQGQIAQGSATVSGNTMLSAEPGLNTSAPFTTASAAAIAFVSAKSTPAASSPVSALGSLGVSDVTSRSGTVAAAVSGGGAITPDAANTSLLGYLAPVKQAPAAIATLHAA